MRNYACYPEQHCHRKNNSSLCLLVIFLSCILCLIPCTLCYAGLAVSVTTGDDWAVGTTGMGVTTETSGDTWTATGSADTLESVYIKVDGTTWSPGSAAGADTFVLKYDTSGSWSSAITNTGNGIELAGLVAEGTQDFDLQFTAPTSTSVGGEHTLTVTLTAVAWACGSGLPIEHTAGTVAPVTKSVTYGTVTSSLSGASKCWITQNLGATNQATAVNDATEASGGWYWQFNRKQGYYQPNANGALISTATPNTWDNSGDNTACDPVVSGTEWCPANDPCTQLLGAGWRLPTYTEWFNVDASGSTWTDWAHAYASVLKLHAAGYLSPAAGILYNRGTMGFYGSSTQHDTDSTYGYVLSFFPDSSSIPVYLKPNGFPVRCIKD